MKMQYVNYETGNRGMSYPIFASNEIQLSSDIAVIYLQSKAQLIELFISENDDGEINCQLHYINDNKLPKTFGIFTKEGIEDAFSTTKE